MSWLNTRQACRRLNYRRRQLRRVAFAIDHRETPAGVEWAEESVQQFLEVVRTGICPHCGYHASLIIRHLRRCQRIDIPELVTDYRSRLVGVTELAAEHRVYHRHLKRLLLCGGVTLSEIELRRRQLVSLRYHNCTRFPRCQNKKCRIRLFETPLQLPPRFEWRNHANIQGYCPACAVEKGKVSPAELTALLNRPLH